MGDLTEYIHRNIGSTGVYIGKLEVPFKPIDDKAEEESHFEKNEPEIIKYLFSNKDHEELIVGTSLKPD